VRWAAATAIVLTATSVTAQAPPDIETILARVGERIAEYYARAQNVVCTEKQTVQPVSRDYMPTGFARVTEYELHVESDAADEAGMLPDARVVRDLIRVNGKPPHEKNSKDRAGCTDGNPLSPEPLAFLLPAHRDEYTFTSAGFGKGRDRDLLVIDFKSTRGDGKGELSEDPNGHADCFHLSVAVVMKGRIWVDAASYHVVRIEQGMAGWADLAVSTRLQRQHNLESNVVVERNDTTIRYRRIPFNDPDDVLLLPESIDTLLVVRGSLESIRSRQVFSDYRRFLTGARIVK
jgi:hypothetical protein